MAYGKVDGMQLKDAGRYMAHDKNTDQRAESSSEVLGREGVKPHSSVGSPHSLS